MTHFIFENLDAGFSLISAVKFFIFSATGLLSLRFSHLSACTAAAHTTEFLLNLFFMRIRRTSHGRCELKEELWSFFLFLVAICTVCAYEWYNNGKEHARYAVLVFSSYISYFRHEIHNEWYIPVYNRRLLFILFPPRSKWIFRGKKSSPRDRNPRKRTGLAFKKSKSLLKVFFSWKNCFSCVVFLTAT